MVTASPVRFGPFVLETETGELRKNGERIPLRHQAVRVLAYLTEHPRQLVTRDDLRAELWAAGTAVDAEHGVNLCIHEIRTALSDDAETPSYVETFPRRGYRFVATVEKGDASGTAPRRAHTSELKAVNQKLMAALAEMQLQASFNQRALLSGALRFDKRRRYRIMRLLTIAVLIAVVSVIVLTAAPLPH